jgi:hypothetical protein
MDRLSRRDILRGAAAALTAGWSLRAAAPCRAAIAWIDRRSYGPFQCTAAFPLAPLDGFFTDLSRLELEIQRTLGLPLTHQTVDVLLLADEASHRTLLAELFPRVPYRRALFVQRGGQGAVYAYRHDELAIDLRHECTHALLHASVSGLPLWLDEGLAEYFEMPEGGRAFDHPHLGTLRWNLRLGMLQTIESLEAQQELGDMGSVEYRFSWAWVHFMLHGPVAAHRALVEYLADIRRGDEAGPLSVRLRQAMPDFEERLVRHFQHWQR